MPSLAAAPHALRDTAAESIRGIAVVAVAYSVMTVGDAATKAALVPAGVAALMVWRGVGGAATIAGFAAAERDLRRLVPVRWAMVLFRSTLHAGVSVSWYLGWKVASLADSYALAFTAPLLMTVLAVPMLGERIRWRRMVSTGVGFCGVLVMVRPGTALWRPEMLVFVPGIVGQAVSRTLTRQLSTTETAECLTFWLMATHVLGGLALLPLGFAWPEALPGWAVPLLAAVGLLSGTAHWLMARAYALAPVAALAPYEYTTLIWGTGLGFLIWGDVPRPSTLAGAAVVAAAGLYNLHRERVRRAEAR